MNWLNINTAQLREPEIILSSMASRGAWLCVMTYCTVHGRGGRLVGARHWRDGHWREVCGVTLKQVNRAAPLLQWEGDDLVVWGYPEARDREVARMREMGQSTSERKTAAARENGKLGGRPARREEAVDGREEFGEDPADDGLPMRDEDDLPVGEAAETVARGERSPEGEAGAGSEGQEGDRRAGSASPDCAASALAESAAGSAVKSQGETQETQRKPKERKEKEREIEKEKKGEGGSGPAEALRATLAPAPVEQPTEEEFVAECARFLVPAEFARDRFLAQTAKGWQGVRDWRALARRVKGWFEGEKATWQQRQRAIAAGSGNPPRGNNGAATGRAGVSLVDFATGALLTPKPKPPEHAILAETL